MSLRLGAILQPLLEWLLKIKHITSKKIIVNSEVFPRLSPLLSDPGEEHLSIFFFVSIMNLNFIAMGFQKMSWVRKCPE